MARNKNRSRRDIPNIANRRLPSISFSQPLLPSPGLSLYEDRRRYHPEGYTRPAKLFNGSSHTLTAIPQKKYRYKALKTLVPETIAFSAPKETLVCVRRKIRREVMFARKKTGKSGQRRPRYNYLSSISCRR